MKIQFQSSNLTIFESALFRTTSTVFIEEEFILIVDPNWLPQEVSFIHDYVENVRNGKSVYLLFTHSDYDHIIGYNAFPDAKVIASKAFVNNPKKESILKEINTFDDQYYISRDYEIAYPEVDIIIEHDFQKLEIGNTNFTFLQAQGHNSDGIITVIESLGIWVVGHYLSNVEFPYVYHSSQDYLETLDKVEKGLEEYTMNILITGHGDHASSKEEIKKRILDSRNYIYELRSCIQKGEDFDFVQLMEPYDFPIVMKEFHDANIELMKKELGI